MLVNELGKWINMGKNVYKDDACIYQVTLIYYYSTYLVAK